MYSHRYIRDDIVSSTDFHVSGEKLRIASFGQKEVKRLSLLLTTIAHYTSEWKHISFPLLFYVDSLFQRPRIVRWSAIILRQFFYNLR